MSVRSTPRAGFDPLALTPDASVNHVVIGESGSAEIAGMRAEDACSRDALCALAARSGLALPPDRLSHALASALVSSDPRTRRAATTALGTYARRLGALIATLRDPRTPDEQGTTRVRQAFLSYWLTVDSVWLAGGLLAGRCGPIILAGAQAGAAAAVRPCPVALTPQPALAPLLGAAQRAGAAYPQDTIVVADLGHTSIRTAAVRRRALAANRIRWHSTRPAPSGGTPAEVEGAVAAALIDVVTHVAGVWSGRVGVVVSVAAYVNAGTPLGCGQGSYGHLAGRVASLRRLVARASGADVTLEFVHDGTAAAATAGSANSATITAGTWLGVGFRPP